jgi:hypothetical protein
MLSSITLSVSIWRMKTFPPPAHCSALCRIQLAQLRTESGVLRSAPRH